MIPPTTINAPTARFTRRLHERKSKSAIDAQSRCAGAMVCEPTTRRQSERTHKMFERSMVVREPQDLLVVGINQRKP